MDIINDVKNFLYEENFKEQFKILTDNDSLLEKGIIDSVKMLELIGFLEQQFAIKVEDDDLFPENFDSLFAIENYVKRKKNSEG